MVKITKHQAVLNALREAGSAGIHSYHMRDIGGLQAPARIQELQERGYDIKSRPERMGNTVGCRYFLIEPQETTQDFMFDKMRKRFFAVANQLGYDSEKVKERAKRVYGVEHFNELKPEHLRILINKLEAQAQMRFI